LAFGSSPPIGVKYPLAGRSDEIRKIRNRLVIPGYIQRSTAFARHGILGLPNTNELAGRGPETVFTGLLGVALACTKMAYSKTGLVEKSIIDFPAK